MEFTRIRANGASVNNGNGSLVPGVMVTVYMPGNACRFAVAISADDAQQLAVELQEAARTAAAMQLVVGGR
jgi:hypothetical protein